MPILELPGGHVAWAMLAVVMAGATAAGCGGPGGGDGGGRTGGAASDRYDDLVALFAEWRAFEQPALRDGAPDYTPAAMAEKARGLRAFHDRLAGIDPAGWPIEQQVDWHLVRAELNGLDFYLRVLRPWARDPAFYASVRTSESDTPAEEGPTIHHAVRLWQYSIWPRTRFDTATALSMEAEERLAAELRTVPPLLEQARGNLAESDARDLWIAGIISIRNQGRALARLAEAAADAGAGLRDAIAAARAATDAFADWLEAEAPSKTGPSGIGRDAYTWHLRNVLLVPLTWEQEVTIMERELARAHAALRLEEQRNRDLPPLLPPADAQAFARLVERSVPKYLDFLAAKRILRVEDWMGRALLERGFDFVPEARRDFFHQATHREPMTLWTHFYHYWDLERMKRQPHASPIRRGPLRYNIWMSRAEGLATVMEEWMMHAGLYDDNPRAREVVWIMLATRAARGLGSLHAHDNTLTMEGAGDLHVEWTPRGWLRRDLDLLGFEQQLYLRQPGYGPSYITGGRMLDGLMAERARQLGDAFTMDGFFAEIDAAGLIPVSLLRWQLTGNGDEIRALMESASTRRP
jgi:hypothetical protein